VSTITDKARRLNLFEPYDTIKVTNGGTSQVTTITSIDCTFTFVSGTTPNDPRACSMTVMPRISAEDGTTIAPLVIQLVSTDTGEIGVKRMLQELPNQVVPSITVDETLGKNSNNFKITFSDSANSGDQHMLKCKVASCDTDGCQPRKKSIKGFYRVATKAAASGNTAAQITAQAAAFTNLKQGVAQFQRYDTGAEDRTVVIASSAATVLTFADSADATNTDFIKNDLADNDKLTVSQIHDFTDDSLGEITGGEKTTAAKELSARSVNGQSTTACIVTNVATGLNTLAGAALSNTIVVAGDMISVKFADGINDGYYKVSASSSNLYTLEGHVTTNTNSDAGQACTVKLIASSPCTVTETQRGTSENAECSSRGNCDGQTGLCTCFSGYVGEDCSTQTVLV